MTTSLSQANSASAFSLDQANAGQEVTIQDMHGLSAGHRQHLQAYGLLPGRPVRILARKPVIIVQVEQTELAFEQDIAREILVSL